MLFSKKIMLWLLMLVLVVGFNACSNDDDEIVPPDDTTVEPTGSFTLPEQPLNEGMVMVEDLSMNKDGWIVVRRDDGNDKPLMTEIISIPAYIEAGTYDSFIVDLEEDIDLKQGERLWVNLHTDNGDGVFTYNGSNDIDMPLYNWDLSWGPLLITHSFLVDLPNPTGSVTAEDQVLEQDRNVIVSSVNNSHSGWIVVYPDEDGQPYLEEPISIPRYLDPGTSSDVEIELEDNIELNNNQLLWVVLHADDGDHVFEFDNNNSIGSDLPVTDAKDSFIISFNWPTGSLTVSDQIIDETRTVLISAIEMDDDGWVILHKNFNEAPLYSETISEPKFLDAGNYENVELNLKEDVEIAFGEKVWVALYSDNGNNIYEYDGTGEIDPPFLTSNGTTVTENFIVYNIYSIGFFWLTKSPSDDVAAIPLFEYEPGWIVVYRDNGNLAPDFSKNVSIPRFIEAGSFASIDFNPEEEISDEEVLWIVLHNDNGDGVFEFDPDTGIDPVAEDEFGRKIIQPFQLGGLTWL